MGKRNQTSKISQLLWWFLIFLGILALYSIIQVFSNRTKGEGFKPELKQSPFVATNRRGDSLAVDLPHGMNLGGFSVQGKYDVYEYNSRGEKRVVGQNDYNFYIVPTTSNPPFLIAVPDIQNEGVSKDIYYDGTFEEETHRVFEVILNGPKGCSDVRDGVPPLVMDVGANLGWFSAYSTAAGCRAIGIEPQPRMQVLINTTLWVNEANSRLESSVREPKLLPQYASMRERATILNNIVNTDSQKLKIRYDNGPCWACSNAYPVGDNENVGPNEYIIPSIRLDSVIKEDVLLMKIDVESYEVRALESALDSITTHNVRNILVEWFPKRWSNLHSIARGNEMLERLCDMGYTIYHYDLRMEYPNTGLRQKNIGQTSMWEIPKDKVADLNNWLNTKAGYGEANLWITKDY